MPSSAVESAVSSSTQRPTLGSVALSVTLGCLIHLGCDAPHPRGYEPWQPGDERLGGLVSVQDTTPNAFSHPAPGLERDDELLFFVGNSFFKRNWVQAPASTSARDGLGPLFNARSCAGCHLKDGRGRPPRDNELGTGLLLRLSLPGTDHGGGPLPEPRYGLHLQDQAIRGFEPEGRLRVGYEEIVGQFADGDGYRLRRPSYSVERLAHGALNPATLTSPRVANQVVGMGLLEAVPELTLLERADEEDQDNDGVSGRANRVWDVRKGAFALGRFGWKANQPTLEQQVASAFFGDMGIANDLFAHPACAASGAVVASACDPTNPRGETEIDTGDLDKVVLYTATLAVPMQRTPQDPKVRRGRRLFFEAGCEVCHREQMTTGAHPIEALTQQVIRPYTDLLLHDMGPDLADGRPDYEATGSEWRTPPLWGLGLLETVNGHTELLHDGRARGFLEAILWHGGEGRSAKEYVLQLSRDDRDALVRFLDSL